MQYLLYEKWGGKPYDIKKSPSNPDDDLMCWAAAASNVLAWTGWGYPTQEMFADENAIFNYFLDHWADAAGYPSQGWEWWFNGQNKPEVATLGGGFWDPPYAFASYSHIEWDRTKVLAAISDGVGRGYGMALDLISQQGGHVLTCWGYEQAEDGTYVGIYTTDSDDPVPGLRYYPIRQDRCGSDEWAQYAGWWYFTYHNGATQFLIGAVHGLDRAIPVQNQPTPQTPTGLRVS